MLVVDYQDPWPSTSTLIPAQSGRYIPMHLVRILQQTKHQQYKTNQRFTWPDDWIVACHSQIPSRERKEQVPPIASCSSQSIVGSDEEVQWIASSSSSF